MSQFTWTIKTPEDMHQKACRELTRFRRAHESDDPGQVDHAINCALTLLNLRDWAFKRYEPTLARRAKFADASGDLRVVKSGADLSHFIAYTPWRAAPGEIWTVIEALANGTKHFELTETRLVNLAVRTSAGNAVGTFVTRPSEGWTRVADTPSEVAEFRMSGGADRNVLVVKIKSPKDRYCGEGIEPVPADRLRIYADRLLEDAANLADEVLKLLAGWEQETPMKR